MIKFMNICKTCSPLANSEIAGTAWPQRLWFTIFMDLSKTYYCLSYDLLTGKLQAYGVDTSCLNCLLD